MKTLTEKTDCRGITNYYIKILQGTAGNITGNRTDILLTTTQKYYWCM